MERAFRYQTGERDEIVNELRKQGMVEVDVDSEGEIRPLLKDLESYGIYEVSEIPWDYEAISFFKEQDFLCRIYVEDRMAESCTSQLFIDFYKEYTEASYDEIFWG